MCLCLLDNSAMAILLSKHGSYIVSVQTLGFQNWIKRFGCVKLHSDKVFILLHWLIAQMEYLWNKTGNSGWSALEHFDEVNLSTTNNGKRKYSWHKNIYQT